MPSKGRAKSAAGNYAGTSALPSVPTAHTADSTRPSLSSTLDGIDELLIKTGESSAACRPKTLRMRVTSRQSSRETLQMTAGPGSDQSALRAKRCFPPVSNHNIIYANCTAISVEVPREPLQFTKLADDTWPRTLFPAITSPRIRTHDRSGNANSPPKSPSLTRKLRRVRTAPLTPAPNAPCQDSATADGREFVRTATALRRKKLLSQISLTKTVGGSRDLTSLEPPDEDELSKIQEKARDASRAGDNACAASICIRGIKLYGEEVCRWCADSIAITALSLCAINNPEFSVVNCNANTYF